MPKASSSSPKLSIYSKSVLEMFKDANFTTEEANIISYESRGEIKPLPITIGCYDNGYNE